MNNYIADLSDFILYTLRESDLPILCDDLYIHAKRWHSSIYSPYQTYQKGQRLYHPGPQIKKWFIVADVQGNEIRAIFDGGDEKCFIQSANSNEKYTFASAIDTFDEIFTKAIASIYNQIVLWADFVALQPLHDLIPFEKLSSAHALNNYLRYRNRSVLEIPSEEDFDIQCKRHNIKSLYYLTRIENLPSILERGILAKNMVPDSHQSFANEDIQAHRHIKVIDPKLGFTLHDYVPLFFVPRPPLLYYMREHQNDLLYIQIKPRILLEPCVLFANMNARMDQAIFSDKITDLDNLKWDILWAKYWNVEGNKEQTEINKRYRQAEAEIPLRIPVNKFRKISVYCNEAFFIVKDMLQQANINLSILECNKNLFF